MSTPAADAERTLFVFHLGGWGGPALALLPLARTLAQGGGAVECFVPEDGAVARMYAELGPVAVADYAALTRPRGAAESALLARRFARDVRGFRAAIRRRQPTRVVVVTTTLPAALLAARLERVPTALYAAELHDDSGPPLRRAAGRSLIRLAAGVADVVVCCSHTVARQFQARHDPIVAYPPIAPDLADGDRGRGRARHGLGDEPCIAVVGALSRGRGQDLAIRALTLIRGRSPDARLLVVGDPHPRAVDLEFARELRRQARDLGLERAVVFAGATGEMADVYAAADIVVNPARVPEAFGRVAPEAAMAGRPVVATRVGALEEVLRDEETALLVPPDDPRRLASAVVRLLEEPELAARLAAAGREDALTRFSLAADRAAWTAALARLAVRTPRGR